MSMKEISWVALLEYLDLQIRNLQSYQKVYKCDFNFIIERVEGLIHFAINTSKLGFGFVDRKWVFYDEVWVDKYGPFDTFQECFDQWTEYCIANGLCPGKDEL